jgi:SulP family sulfate permease
MSDGVTPRLANSTARTRSRLIAIFPIIGQLRQYRVEWLARDAGAGLAIAALALPIGIAYPEIAGLPPAIGLYSTILALLGYAAFGSSRQLIVGPDAATLTVVAAALTQLAVVGPGEREAVSATLAIIVGILCFLSAAGGLGVISNFLSRPVLTGYLCGISVSLFVGQIGRLTTVKVSHIGLIRPLVELSLQAGLIHIPTLVTGLTAFLLLRVLKAAAPRVPGPPAVLALATLLSFAFDFQSSGIAVMGRIPATLPTLGLSVPPIDRLDNLALSGLGILIVSFSSGIVTARSFGAKNRYRVDANRELVGFGAANIASGLFGGFAVTGADSRTAVNDAAGGRTQVAGIIAALTLILILWALSGALQYLPITVLGAILASAALDLFDVKELRWLWRTSRVEFTFAAIAMAGVVAVDVLKGVIIAIVATLVYLLARATRPHDALLGRIPGHEGFYKLHREPKAKPMPGLALYLLQGSLLFFNSDYVRDRIRWIVGRLPPTTRWFILDAEAITTIDSTAAAALEEVRRDLERRQIRFGLANLHSQPRQLLARAGLLASIGPDMLFEHSEDAALAFEKLRLSE